MLGTVLNHASRSRRMRRTVEAFAPTRRLVNRFVAGERPDEAVAVVRRLTAEGMTTTVDVLGEDVADEAGARRTAVAYRELLDGLAAAGSGEMADVSLKLSAVGQALPRVGQMVATELAREVCDAAAAVGATVSLDMEDHTTVDSSLAIAAELRQTFPQVASVLQANLRRSAADITTLADSTTRIRWVKGAYKESASVAFQRKVEVDAAYEAGIRALMTSSCHPQIATHDPRMIAVAIDAARVSGRSSAQWELQMLYGIRTDLQRELRAAGHQVRIYVPFGQDWYAYFMRRLAERPANVAFFARALVRS